MEDKQKSIDLCNQGIVQKKLGNIEKALEYYNAAKIACMTNQDVYYNIAKILIGLGNYSDAFKNLMTYSHLSRIKADTPYFTDNIFMSEMWFLCIDNYSWDFQLTNQLAISESDLNKISFALAPFYSMVLDINSSFLAGLCYILEDKERIQSFNIQESQIIDIKNGLLGKQSNSYLKNSNITKKINSLGLFYIITNYALIVNDLSLISNIYFGDNFVANNNLSTVEMILKINYVSTNSYFIEKEPENPRLNVELSFVRTLLQQHFKINSVFVGYVKLTTELFDKAQEEISLYSFHLGDIPIGKVTLTGFDIESIRKVVQRTPNIYLCYYAIPINDANMLIENCEYDEEDVMYFISDIHKCQVAYEGSINFDHFEYCRTFKLTLIA